MGGRGRVRVWVLPQNKFVCFCWQLVQCRARHLQIRVNTVRDGKEEEWMPAREEDYSNERRVRRWPRSGSDYSRVMCRCMIQIQWMVVTWVMRVGGNSLCDYGHLPGLSIDDWMGDALEHRCCAVECGLWVDGIVAVRKTCHTRGRYKRTAIIKLMHSKYVW